MEIFDLKKKALDGYTKKYERLGLHYSIKDLEELINDFNENDLNDVLNELRNEGWVE